MTTSAIRSGLGAGDRSSRVKISRTCDTVTAGVFPPDPQPLQDQEPQRQQRQRHVVVPAHPAPHLVLPQPDFPLRRAEHLLDPVPREPDPDQLGQRHLRAGVAQRVIGLAASPRPSASPPAAPPARPAAPPWSAPARPWRRPAAAPARRRGPSAGSTATSGCRAAQASARQNGTSRLRPRPARRRGGRRRSRSRTFVLQGTSSTYRSPCRRSQPRNCAGRPISSSPLTQAWGRSLRHRSSRSTAIRHDSWKVTASGTWHFCAAAGVGRPVLGQVQPAVQRRVAAGGGVGEEDAELAVVLLAQPAAPLPGHPARLAPRLGEAAGVEDQDRLRVGQHLADVAAEFGHDGLVVPPAGADEVLDRLAVDAGLDGDRLAGLALQPAEQAADDERGVGPLLGAVEAGQVALQEGR